MTEIREVEPGGQGWTEYRGKAKRGGGGCGGCFGGSKSIFEPQLDDTEALAEEWHKAKRARDFQRADELRGQLRQLGVEIEPREQPSPDGQVKHTPPSNSRS